MKRSKSLVLFSLLLAAALLAGCGMNALLPSEMEAPAQAQPEQAAPAEPEEIPAPEPEEIPEPEALPAEEIPDPEEAPAEAEAVRPEETEEAALEVEETTPEAEEAAPEVEEEAPAAELSAGTLPQAPDPSQLPPLPEVDIHSWQFMLGNSYNSVAFYYPKELAYFESQGMDARIYDDTLRLITDARDAGCPIYIAVGYRNQDFMLYLTLNGMYAMPDAREAWKHTQPMGTNEHQMGLGIDFTDEINNAASYYAFWDSDPETSVTFQWLMEHSQDYGFIYRYPAEKQAWYGTPCGHWHFRYVGVEAAQYMKENDLCLEEFLRLYDPNAAFIPEHGNIYE